jgi:hypothetical protein
MPWFSGKDGKGAKGEDGQDRIEYSSKTAAVTPVELAMTTPLD